MKFACFFFLFMGAIGSAEAQSVQNAQRLLCYERYDSAGRLLHKLIEENPNNSSAWWLLTQVELHANRTTQIKDSLSRLLSGNPNAPMILCAYGQVLLHQQKKDSAAVCFNKALEETKQKDPIILLAVARAQIEDSLGDPAYAATLLNKAISREKRNVDLYLALGNSYRRLQNGSDAYKAYQDALIQQNNCAEAFYRLGKIFISQGNQEMYLKYFNDAVQADPAYAPAWYELYYHYYFRDVNKAGECLQHYIACSDNCSRNDYLLTDLMFVSKKYDEAISNANRLITDQGKNADPKLFKLIAYSYKELNDSSKALDYMRHYFNIQTDTDFVVKDFETMGDIYADLLHRADSAAPYYAKAVEMQKDSVQRVAYYRKLAEIYKKLKDYPDQAIWLGKYYQASPKATNLDLFNWGLASYMAKNYQEADTVFGLYEAKYPDQEFGYYWRARDDAAIDTAMNSGLAIPHYLKLIAIAGADTANRTTRKHLIESYGYLAAYNANTKKDYPAAIDYFEKLLSLDPENKDASRYIEVLKKNLNKKDTSKAGK